MVDFFTNFEYKDERAYVHSSSMCEFLSERVVPELGLQVSDIRLDARFHRVAVNNGIMHCQDVPSESSLGSELAAEFKIISGSKIFYVYFLEGEEPVTNRTKTRYLIEDLELKSPFSGTCRIKIDDTRSFLENIFEANKRLHKISVDNNLVKVINLYMKRFPLGLMQNRNGWYTLNIRHIGTRNHNDGLVTLNSLSFKEIDSPPFEICYLLPETV